MHALLPTLVYIFSLWCPLSEGKSIQGRLIGGTPATIGQFPFIAAIYINTFESTYFGQGLLVNDRWILTSAFTVEGALSVRIALGSNALSGSDPNRITIESELIFSHPQYDSLSLENDIALIKLPSPVAVTASVKPIDLLPQDDIVPLESLVVAGWGVTSAGSGLSNALRHISLVSIPNESCQQVYGSVVNERMVCALGARNESICDGDVGAPLLSYQSAPLVTAVGVGSFYSAAGCDIGHPSGFTRIHSYHSWIERVIETE